MKPIQAWLISAILLALLLAGCTDSSVPDTGGQAAPPTAPTQPHAPELAAPALSPTASQSPLPASSTPAAGLTQLPTLALNCTAPAQATVAMTEGPYYTPNAPERTSLLEPGVSGTRLVITGYVLDTSCQPIPNALLDFWQADASGQYDNAGFTLRGRQYTDESGSYTLETVIPGMYPGRTEHIHVKVQPPDGAVLTTQLFFPESPGNDTDRIFDPSLVLPLQEGPDGYTATFNFVVTVP